MPRCRGVWPQSTEKSRRRLHPTSAALLGGQCEVIWIYELGKLYFLTFLRRNDNKMNHVNHDRGPWQKMESCRSHSDYFANFWELWTNSGNINLSSKLFSNWMKLVPNEKTKTMYENNKAILVIMGNTTHKQTCVLNPDHIENWPESSHKITVCVNPWIAISSQKYSEYQVCHLHKQSPPTNVPSLNLRIKLDFVFFHSVRICPFLQLSISFNITKHNTGKC